VADKLDTLLRLRRRVLREATVDHAAAAVDVETVCQEIAAKENEIADERARVGGGLMISFSDYEKYARLALADLETLIAVRDDAERQLAVAKDRLQAAFCDVKVVEQVCARKEAEARRERKRAEQAKLDEIATARYLADRC
jgi:flagellar export protein FliJ